MPPEVEELWLLPVAMPDVAEAEIPKPPIEVDPPGPLLDPLEDARVEEVAAVVVTAPPEVSVWLLREVLPEDEELATLVPPTPLAVAASPPKDDGPLELNPVPAVLFRLAVEGVPDEAKVADDERVEPEADELL